MPHLPPSSFGARVGRIRWRRLERPATGSVWAGTESGRPVFLKQVHSARGFAQETHALRVLAGPRLPTLLGADAQSRLLLLAGLPGQPARPADRGVHVEAGRWLRTLHDRTVRATDPMPLAKALAHRAHRAVTRARRHGPVDPRIIAAIGLDRPFESCARAWCHRDFTPRNWLWCPDAGLGIVDLEHARPDHPAWDIVKLRTEVWPHQPAAERAFRQGYGPLPLERTLERLCWLHALQTRTWGRDHADASAVAVGERALLHLIARRSPG